MASTVLEMKLYVFIIIIQEVHAILLVVSGYDLFLNACLRQLLQSYIHKLNETNILGSLIALRISDIDQPIIASFRRTIWFLKILLSSLVLYVQVLIFWVKL